MKNSNGWTPERRAKQAAAIRRWEPWRKSTGPRTSDGKAIASRNGLSQNPCRGELAIIEAELRQLLRLVRRYMKRMGREKGNSR